MLSLLGITMRYFNNTTDQRGFALSLIFYIPACWIMILEITRYISTKSKTVILSNSQRFIYRPGNLLALSFFVTLNYKLLSVLENTTYMNRMVWVYSIVYVPTFLVCSSTQCSCINYTYVPINEINSASLLNITRFNLTLIIIYRFLTMKDNICLCLVSHLS